MVFVKLDVTAAPVIPTGWACWAFEPFDGAVVSETRSTFKALMHEQGQTAFRLLYKFNRVLASLPSLDAVDSGQRVCRRPWLHPREQRGCLRRGHDGLW